MSSSNDESKLCAIVVTFGFGTQTIICAIPHPMYFPLRLGRVNSSAMRCLASRIFFRYPSWEAADLFRGFQLSLKKVNLSEHPYEVEINTFLLSESDMRNHCVPVLDVSTVPDIEDIAILVTPSWLPVV
jgi:hypothetical protein